MTPDEPEARETPKEMDEIDLWLREQAKSHSNFTKSMQARRTAEYVARGDVDADYRGIEAEDTNYWKAADTISTLRARIAELTTVSDEMVERGAMALFRIAHTSDNKWEECEDLHPSYKEEARAALTAAMKEEPPHD